MGRRVTLIPGDGIGPEVTEAARRVLDATGVELDWEVHRLGYEAGGEPLPAAALASIERNGAALKGPVATPAGGERRSVNVALRRALDLYAQVRPCRSFAGVPSRYDAVDVVVVRETTEDLYAGIEVEKGSDEALELIRWLEQRGHSRLRSDTAFSLKPLSETAARRIFEFAFEWARRHGRSRITVVHKATVMKHTDGLFLAVAGEVAAANADVELDDGRVDHVAMELARRPERFDVLVAPNLYGDVLSDLAAGLVGGPGLAPGANYGPSSAVFEPAHGTAPRHAGAGRANPVAAILSGALLLRHIDEEEAGALVEAAVAGVLADGQRATYDLLPASPVGTAEFADAIIERLGA